MSFPNERDGEALTRRRCAFIAQKLGLVLVTLLKLTSSWICDITSQPARLTAGVMNFVQMSRSLRSVLFTLKCP